MHLHIYSKFDERLVVNVQLCTVRNRELDRLRVEFFRYRDLKTVTGHSQNAVS